MQVDTIQSDQATGSSAAASDPVFQAGLQAILAPYYQRGAPQEEIDAVTARAEAFYLQSQHDSASAPQPPADEAPATGTTSDDPPYPLSFASLAALIASGAPIPGIKQIPDKLAEGEPSESRVDTTRVKKPWERESPSADLQALKEANAEEGSGQV